MTGFASFESVRFPSPRTLSVLAGAVTLSLAVMTVAAPRGADFPISVPEARDRAEARFQELDADGSGEISAAEIAAAPEHHRFVHRVRHRHMGHDGKHDAMSAEMFERLDEDGDGLLSKAEFDERKMRQARHEAAQERLFARLDQDGSGGLSRDELPDRARRLAAMDSDGDGMVTREEARAHRAAGHEMRRAEKG